jgi:hypothetical protein
MRATPLLAQTVAVAVAALTVFVPAAGNAPAAVVGGTTAAGVVVGTGGIATHLTGALSSAPPRRSGYFKTRPVGAWDDLPGGRRCTRTVHRSTWEPRPDNAGPNSRMPRVGRVHRAFENRPRSLQHTYHRRWDRWLLPRVTGHFTGRTDEVFQWAACKWGISDNVLRAIAVRESTWFQHEIYPSGRCVVEWGCGDFFETPSAASSAYCDAIARQGRDYQLDFGAGNCPKTFSIVGVMSWQDPEWGAMRANQNGTFPFNRDSTAFAVDYLGATLRGCYEGWILWLADAGPAAYTRGDLWGCVGTWYSGEWRSAAALGYIGNVRRELADRTWLQPGWEDVRPACSPDYGCPRGS